MMRTFPELHSFALNDNITVMHAKSNQDIYSMFQLPLSIEAYQQHHALSVRLHDIRTLDNQDTWKFLWETIISVLKRSILLLLAMSLHLCQLSGSGNHATYVNIFFMLAYAQWQGQYMWDSSEKKLFFTPPCFVPFMWLSGNSHLPVNHVNWRKKASELSYNMRISF